MCVEVYKKNEKYRINNKNKLHKNRFDNVTEKDTML